MEKIIFNDKMRIKTLTDGKISDYPCDFYENYMQTARSLKDKDEWKYSGEGAKFRGDYYDYSQTDVPDNSYFNSLDFISADNVLFSATINDVSCVMRKDLTAEKSSESHVIHSQDLVFSGTDLNQEKTSFVTSIKDNFINSHIAVFDLKTDDYTVITGGDCADRDASFSKTDENVILFSTKGVGRNSNGEFVRYSPSSICSFDRDSGQIDELVSDKEDSFVKPKNDANGNLYYIKRSEKKKVSFWRIVLDVLLIPWKILVAIYYFLETFTLIFSGKKFIKDGSNPAKQMDKSKQQLLIEDNLINADKEYKNNLRHKDAYAGIAPRSWELIKQSPDGTKRVVKRGVIDYCLTSQGIVLTNGKHVLLVKDDGTTEKLASSSLCTKVACAH